MKKLFYGGLFLAAIGIGMYGCKKGDDYLPIKNQGSNDNSLKSIQIPGQFSFDSEQLTKLEEDLDLFAKAITSIASNETLLQLLFNRIVEPEQDEELSIQELEDLLTANSIDLWTMLENAMEDNQYSSSEILRVREIYKNFTINNSSYTTYIYIPFTNLVDFDNRPFFTSQVKSITELNELKVYSRNFSGDIELVQINENQAQNEPVIFISIISDDKIEYAALPWSWCECTRDSQWIDGNGQTHTSTMGTCENRGDCSRCGRSDIRGNCRGGSCPGC